MTVPFQRKAVYLLVLFNILPQVGVIPYWSVMCALFFLLLRWRFEGKKLSHHWNWAKYIMAVSSTVVVYSQYGTLFGLEASATLLTLMMSIKLFEFRGYRDAMVITYLCYFLLMTKLLDSQSLFGTLFLVFDVIAITSVLALFHAPGDIGYAKKLVRRSMRMTLQALPLFLMLFFLFPRFSAGFFQNPDEEASVSQFGETVDPGSLSRLFLSDEVVFRATIDQSKQPHMTDLYWRGSVLDQTENGLKWIRSEALKKERRPQPMKHSQVQSGSKWVVQDVFMEPSNEKWLFALDWPRRLEFSHRRQQYTLRYRPGSIYESRSSIKSRLYYRVFSRLDPIEKQPLSQEDRALFMDFEGVEAPQTKALVDSWIEQGLSEDQLVQKISSHFSGNDYRYTLSPPKVKSLDHFMFETKQGVCEHYAASVATMLRMARVPARLVIGFHGAESTLFEDYLIVRQKNAHVWVEYWDSAKQYWQRLDPTSEVAPGRILLGSTFYDNMLSGGATTTNRGDSWWSQLTGREGLGAVWIHTQLTWDQIESAWVGFLLRYNFSYQQELLKKLGWQEVSRWGLFFLTGISLLIGVLGLLHIQKKSTRNEPLLRLYKSLCAALHKKGLDRERNEGPLAFKKRAIHRFPERAEDLNFIFDRIIEGRYADQPVEVSSLRRRVRRLKL